jgi:integrase/recombinase XerD
MPKRGRQKRRPLIEASHPPGTIAAWSTEYLKALRVRHFSEITIRNREVYLVYFLRWCEARALKRPEEITKPLLDRYQRHLFYYRKEDGKPLSFRSQHGRLLTVRGLFKWLTRENVLLYNPASELELPKLEQPLPKAILTVDEVEKVLAVPDLEDPVGFRDRTMLEVLYSTGIRRKELVDLRVFDFNPDRGTLFIRHGKGNKERFVPIGERASEWVVRYLEEVRPRLAMPPDDMTMFLTVNGEPFLASRLTELVREYVLAAGLGKKGSCHLFRHTMATLMLEGGAELTFIQEMLGHTDPKTTQIYTHVSILKLKEIHAATHPGAKSQRGNRSRQ